MPTPKAGPRIATVLVVLALGCSSDSERPGPIGTSGRGGAAQAGGGAGGTSNGGRGGSAGRGGGSQGGASGSGATSNGGSGGGSGGSVPSECNPQNPESCTGDTVCRCCPHASGGDVCLCVVPCSDGADCTDPERPYCDQEGSSGGMCVEDDAFCCWDC